ncbi:transcription initiation factor TFIID [Paenibacillus sp. NFR01]|uniref:transcription initiation factor TFIID n=1 Tax=Paenibacillus sp. NFR01 TaxID=1566279 RepID=UPI0008C91EFE|nr:transcription initiation factor TFIID [Paenibacillus sp. NFR01]SEU01689.1 hypothetical protein SAMN03159358_3108 [Paenibacillus sp. NFR01]
MMKAKALRYAESYAAQEEAQRRKGDGRSSIHYPALFLFIGDKTASAIGPVLDSCERKWDNAAGVMALHAASRPAGRRSGSANERAAGREAAELGDGIQGYIGSGLSQAGTGAAYGSTRDEDVRAGKERVLFAALPDTAGRDPLTVRRDVYEAFREDSRYLAGLNRALRQLAASIADYGRLYSSFDVIHLSIITRVDDPLNVLLPQITLLARAVLAQSFKSVQSDLYALINEREQGEQFGYSSSVGLAFLRELEGMQQPDYTLHAPLLVTEDGLSIPVNHGPAALFDLVYVLSDKNERGMTSPHGMDDNYEIIAHISLLKNRVRPSADFASGHGGYNNMIFKSGIRGGTGRQGCASAGFAAVRRPNRQIALAVLYHAARHLTGELRAPSPLSQRERQALLGVSPEALRERAAGFLPDAAGLAEMTGLMSRGRPSLAELKRLSLREAEEVLFGSGGEAYFRRGFEDEAAAKLAAYHPEREWAKVLAAREQGHPPLTFYQLAEWTAEQGEAGGTVLNALHQHMAGLRAGLATARLELEQLYADSVERQPFTRVPLLEKRTVRNLIHYLFERVYGRKYDLLRLETELALCRSCAEALERLHAESTAQIKAMDVLVEELRQLALDSIGRGGETVDQNIMEYYAVITEGVIQEIEARKGPGALFGDRYLGSLPGLLRSGGADAVLERLIDVCRRELLAADIFDLPFEEELLRRANVAAAYDNQGVVSKEELFKRLYLRLEEGALINVRLFEYTQEHRHEEKYFFGDSGSEFLRYASGVDETTRIYRLGVVHEERRSGAEKLNLMGGFHLEDLLYYRNAKVYYETYVANGYRLHGLEEAELPALR